MSKDLKVGIVGTGLMGQGLARNVVAAGYGLSFLRRAMSEGARLVEGLGAKPVGSISDLVKSSDVVMICVTGTPEVESIMLDPGGVLDAAEKNLSVFDFSTSLPASTRKLAKLMKARGQRFIDSAMTGLPPDAENGEVSLIVGCEARELGDEMGILEAVSKTIHFVGTPGAGHAIKLIHQSVVLGNVAVLAEAFACARTNGIDLGVLSKVIGSGGADSKAFQRLRPSIESGNVGGFRFSLGNALKDMEYYCDFAAQSGMTTFVAAPVFNTYALAAKDGLSGRFVPALLDYVAELNASRRPHAAGA